MSDIGARRMVTSYRIRAIKIGLNFSWIVVGVLVIEAVRLRVLNEPPAFKATIGLAVMLTALNLIPWDTVADTGVGKLLLWLWGASMLAGLGRP